MKTKLTKTTLAVVATGVVLMTAPSASAQTSAEMAQRLAKNNEDLRRYSWTTRVEVRHEGETVTGLYKMRYDIDGVMQSTPMTSGAPGPEEVQAGIRELAELAMSYAQPGPYEFQRFLNGAQFWEGRGPTSGTLRVEGGDMHFAGDSVTLTIENGQPRRLDAKTTFNAQPTELRADYRQLPNNGPHYVARMVIEYPDLEILIETFDYLTNAGPPVTTVTVPQGTTLHVRTTQPLSSKENQTGQTFTSILEDDVVVDGRMVLPQGTRVVGRIAETQRSGRTSGRARMSLILTAVYLEDGPVAIQTELLRVEAESTQGRDARRTGRLAGLGAIVGGIAGGGSGLAKGVAVGVGTGAVVNLSTRGDEVEFPAEQLFVFRLAVQAQFAVR